MSLIDVRTRTKTPDDITVGAGPVWVAVTPDGKTAFVTNIGSGTVSTIDVKTRTKHPTDIAVGSVPQNVAVTPDGKTAFVANRANGTVSTIDVKTRTKHTADISRPVPSRGGVHAVSLTRTDTRPDLRRTLVQTCVGKVRIRNS